MLKPLIGLAAVLAADVAGYSRITAWMRRGRTNGSKPTSGNRPPGERAMMKLATSIFRGLAVVTLVCGLLPAQAQAQFSQQAKLVGTGVIGSLAAQGWAVSLSADGNTAIVGGPSDNDFAGAAWVFVRAHGVWTRQAKLVGTGALGQAEQGISVSLSADGNTAVVGGSGDNTRIGAAWIFTRLGGVWSQQAKLVATDAVGSIVDQGSSVSISADGDTVIVGGFNDNNEVGAAWVYTRSGGVWNEQAKLVGTGAVGTIVQQGFSVALSGDGNTAIVGGSADNVGAAWVYTRLGGVWNQQAKLVGTGAIGNAGIAGIGQSVSLSADGNTAISGGDVDNGGIGAAWVFTRSGGVWNQQAKLVGTGAIGNAGQGNSVSLSGNGNIAIVGGPFDNPQGLPNADQIGAAWIFTRSGEVWSQQEKLVGTGVMGFASQGNSVSLSAKVVRPPSVGLSTIMLRAQRGCSPSTRSPGRPARRTVTARASRRWRGSLAASMARPPPWGLPAWTHCKMPFWRFAGNSG